MPYKSRSRPRDIRSVMALVKLVSSDGKEFPVEPKIARMSTTVAGLLEALNMDDTNEDPEVFAKNPIPLPNVSEGALQRVLDWCYHHKDEPAKVKSTDPKAKPDYTIPEWDIEFFPKEQKELFELLCAAHYLDIRALYDNLCQTVANMLHGKKADEMAKLFNIKCDLTQKEIDDIRKANAWCED
ncbi:hypothetical protein PENTCL1PPCAC_3844 [Pristionchus entomophagus]|uniref:Skp1-related protein n=1 Tax=Pristionchus entomophagus TaxID=358040 RepID=A0AAV5SND0_9BILA|nr:hypothetical protein PENTCL1PPCAC_3844 [Pristionchus entomophagus]